MIQNLCFKIGSDILIYIKDELLLGSHIEAYLDFYNQVIKESLKLGLFNYQVYVDISAGNTHKTS